MKEEIWRPVVGYEDYYQVSNYGRVKSSYCGRVLKPELTNDGYLRVELWKNHKGKKICVHYIVYTSFNGQIPDGMQINHINEIKSDNRPENLNVLTPKENINWGTHNERMRKTKRGMHYNTITRKTNGKESNQSVRKE